MIGLPVLMLLCGLPPHVPGALPDVRAADASPRQLQDSTNTLKPRFALFDLEGLQHPLDAKAGHVVLVHFFATWCEPCREELSSLSRLVARMPTGRFSVLAVNVAEVPTRVRRFLDAAPVNFPVLLDTNRAVTKAWDVNILPTTFVLDRALAPRLFVEGDIDWMRADVLAALEHIDTESPK